MQSVPLNIRPATPNDSPSIARIYNHYIVQSIITFEEQPVPDEEIARRISEVLSASLPWLVAERNGRVIGYAYASPWKNRSGYRFSAEITIYLADGESGRGAGSALYTQLFEILMGRGVHAVMAGIALPNDVSIALHEKFGMTKVAHFEEIGFKFDQWIDVGYWQRKL